MSYQCDSSRRRITMSLLEGFKSQSPGLAKNNKMTQSEIQSENIQKWRKNKQQKKAGASENPNFFTPGFLLVLHSNYLSNGS